jgi:hypothetical protein
LQRNPETAREQPKPRDRYQGRVQTNEIQQNKRRGSPRRVIGRAEARPCD